MTERLMKVLNRRLVRVDFTSDYIEYEYLEDYEKKEWVDTFGGEKVIVPRLHSILVKKRIYHDHVSVVLMHE